MHSLIEGILIVEFFYSIRKELANKIQFYNKVKFPQESRLLGGFERDGEEDNEMWENNWMISEDIMLKKINLTKEPALFLLELNK